jgi:hypothetical protein
MGRAVAAALARSPTEVRNVELRTPPKRPPMPSAVERTTAPNMALAEEIDEVDKLSDDELKGLRAKVAIEVAAAANDVDTASREQAAARRAGEADGGAAAGRLRSLQSAHAKLLLRLEAIEYVANWRRLPPLRADRFRYQDTRRELANRRANFRLEIEERVRKTGSLDDALDGMPADAEEVQAIRKEAAEFAGSFKSRAWDNARRMLITSQDVMHGVLKSYGVPTGLVERAVRYRMHDDKMSASAAAQWVVDEILKGAPEELDKTVNAKDAEDKRARLVAAVRRLKPLQQKVKDLAAAASGLNTRAGVQSSVDAMNRAIRELPVAKRELAAEWMEAERAHQVLAAYRGDQRDLEKLDLAQLDVSGEQTNALVKEVLVRVLPKLYDNGRALWLLEHNRLKPMAMPPVVALTSATMFVPEGSIRAGVVRDLLDEEKGSRSGWLLTVATVALAIVTLLPTGGMSAAVLIPAGIASAGLAAYSALKIYEKYEKQKLLVNTDLDLSRALSNEQPSLRGFAFNLVAAGLEGFALFRLWRKAVELRKLAFERQTLREAIDEFKTLMNEHRLQADTDRFLDDVLRGTPADRSAAAGGGGKPPTSEPPKPPSTPGRKPPTAEPPPVPAKKPAVKGEKPPAAGEKPPAAGEKPPAAGEKPSSTQAEKPPASKGGKGAASKLPRPVPPPLRAIHVYRSRQAVVEAVEKRLTAAGMARPPGWERVIEALKASPGPNNEKILAKIETVMGALQNPRFYAEVLGDAWQLVKSGKATDINDALVKMVEATGVKVSTVKRVKLGGEFFKEIVSKREAWIDEALATQDHGQMSHLLQDLVVDKALGAGGSAEFRSTLLANAEGTIQRYVQRRPGDTLRSSRYTQLSSGQELPNSTFMDVKDAQGTLLFSETEMTTGDYVWRFTYDLFYEGRAAVQKWGRLPQPERLRPALNEIHIELK